MNQKGKSGRDLVQVGRDNVSKFLEIAFYSKNTQVSSEFDYYVDNWHQFDEERQLNVFYLIFGDFYKKAKKLKVFDENLCFNFWTILFIFYGFGWLFFSVLFFAYLALFSPLTEEYVRGVFDSFDSKVKTIFFNFHDPRHTNFVKLEQSFNELRITIYTLPYMSLTIALAWIIRRSIRMPLVSKSDEAKRKARMLHSLLNSSQRGVVEETLNAQQREHYDELLK